MPPATTTTVTTTTRLVQLRERPDTIISDNGTQLTLNAIMNMSRRHRHRPASHRARQGQQTGYSESFNGRLGDERLNGTLFGSLHQARTMLERRRRDDTEQRPHSKPGWLTPRAFADAPPRLCSWRLCTPDSCHTLNQVSD